MIADDAGALVALAERRKTLQQLVALRPDSVQAQFALFTSLAAVPRTFINSSVGYIVAETGWFTFFIVCFMLALPGMLILPKVAPWNEKRVAD